MNPNISNLAVIDDNPVVISGTVYIIYEFYIFMFYKLFKINFICFFIDSRHVGLDVMDSRGLDEAGGQTSVDNINISAQECDTTANLHESKPPETSPLIDVLPPAILNKFSPTIPFGLNDVLVTGDVMTIGSGGVSSVTPEHRALTGRVIGNSSLPLPPGLTSNRPDKRTPGVYTCCLTVQTHYELLFGVFYITLKVGISTSSVSRISTCRISAYNKKCIRLGTFTSKSITKY